MNEENFHLGDLQVYDPTLKKWNKFELIWVLNYLSILRKYPKTRAWDGTGWIKYGLREHIMQIMNRIGEDIE